MGRIKRCDQIRTGRDAEKLGSRHDWTWRKGKGNHIVGHHPEFQGAVAVPGGELSRGVRSVVIKAFALVGIPLLIGLCYVLYYFGGLPA